MSSRAEQSRLGVQVQLQCDDLQIGYLASLADRRLEGATTRRKESGHADTKRSHDTVTLRHRMDDVGHK
jgi:hypothetical protein